MKSKFPRVHVARLERMVRDIQGRERELQSLCGDPVPRSIRARNLLDLRALQEILWCISKAEDEK